MLTLTRTTADYERLARQVLAPPETVDFWDWCRRHLITYHGSRWDENRALLMRHWYRVAEARLTGRSPASDPHAHRCEQIYLALSAQIAKSTFLYALALYVIRHHPRRLALVMANLKGLASVRKTRVERMLLQMPQVERLLPRGEEARERALGPASWTVGTALLFWLCGSVAGDLRMHDLPLMLLDEFDTFPADVDDYGDPVDQCLVRQRTYGRSRLLVATSTPGAIAGHAWSRLDSQGAASHERPLVLCPSCGGAGWLDPRQIQLAGDRDLTQVRADEITSQHLARWACRHCGELHGSDAVRAMAIDAAAHDRWCSGTWAIDQDHPQGHWQPHADLDAHGRLIAIPPWTGHIRSGQANALYSRDVTLDAFAAALAIARQGTSAKLKAHINNDWAEPYLHSAASDQADTDALCAGAQAPGGGYRLGALPTGCAATWLLLHFDQQGNQRADYWYPWVLRAVAPGGASWLLACGKAGSEAERDAVAEQTWPLAGVPTRAHVVSLDSANGNALWDAYTWAAREPSRRCLLKGDARLPDGIPYQQVVDAPNTRRRTPKPAGVREWRIAPHHWRTVLWDRIRHAPAALPWHLPQDPPAYYLRSLTAEEQALEIRRAPGGGQREAVVWRPRLVSSTADRDSFRDDNHWWDAEASLAALIAILGWDRDPSAVRRTPTRRLV